MAGRGRVAALLLAPADLARARVVVVRFDREVPRAVADTPLGRALLEHSLANPCRRPPFERALEHCESVLAKVRPEPVHLAREPWSTRNRAIASSRRRAHRLVRSQPQPMHASGTRRPRGRGRRRSATARLREGARARAPISQPLAPSQKAIAFLSPDRPRAPMLAKLPIRTKWPGHVRGGRGAGNHRTGRADAAVDIDAAGMLIGELVYGRLGEQG